MKSNLKSKKEKLLGIWTKILGLPTTFSLKCVPIIVNQLSVPPFRTSTILANNHCSGILTSTYFAYIFGKAAMQFISNVILLFQCNLPSV